jgi:hypothetical protein
MYNIGIKAEKNSDATAEILIYLICLTKKILDQTTYRHVVGILMNNELEVSHELYSYQILLG